MDIQSGNDTGCGELPAAYGGCQTGIKNQDFSCQILQRGAAARGAAAFGRYNHLLGSDVALRAE